MKSSTAINLLNKNEIRKQLPLFTTICIEYLIRTTVFVLEIIGFVLELGQCRYLWSLSVFRVLKVFLKVGINILIYYDIGVGIFPIMIIKRIEQS